MNTAIKYGLFLFIGLFLSFLSSIAAFSTTVQPPIDAGEYKIGLTLQGEQTDYEYDSITAKTVHQGLQITNEYGVNEYITGGFQFGLSSLDSGKFIWGTDQFNTDGGFGFSYGTNLTFNYLENYWGMDWFIDWQYRKLNSDPDNGSQELTGQRASFAWHMPVQGIHTNFGLQYERSVISISGTRQQGDPVSLEGDNADDIGLFVSLQSKFDQVYDFVAQGALGHTFHGEVGLKRTVFNQNSQKEKSVPKPPAQTESQENTRKAESNETTTKKSESTLELPERMPQSNWKEQFNEGVKNYRNQKYQRALQLFSKAHTAHPQKFEIKVWLATTHFELKNYEQAKKYIQRALEERPNYEHGRQLLQKIEDINQELEPPEGKAKPKTGGSGPKQEPQISVQTFIDSGNKAVREGQLNRGRNFYERARERQPQNVTIHSNLGSIYYRQGNYEKALQNYKRAFEIQPDDERTNLYLGLTYYRLDRPESARRHFQRVVDSAPESRNANKAKQWLEKLE